MKTGADKPPHAFVIPAGQRDQTQVDRVVNLLRRQAIEVHRATGEIKVKEGTFPAGSYIVKLNQPYGPLAKTLLEKQTYPDPALTTYDDSAWTMGLANNIDVKTIEDKTILDAAGDAADRRCARRRAPITGTRRRHIVVKHNGSLNLITLRYRLKDVPVQGGEGGVQGRRRRVPGGLVHHRIRPAIACARRSSRSGLQAHGRRVGADGARPSTSICRASRCTRPGRTPKRSAGCGSPSIAGRFRSI